MALVKDPNDIKIAMVGMVEANGHPYSWTAIINGGYDPVALAESEYAVISDYLGAAGQDALGIDGARVTHIWCENQQQARHVAKSSFIPNVVENATDVIGQVDAIIIPAATGQDAADRARPFVEAGLPIFIDKPLTNRVDHLQQFIKWQQQGHPILSSSAMRYDKDFVAARSRMDEIGDLRLITHTTAKSWELYGIHTLEGVYPFLEPGGWVSVANTGTEQANMVHVKHAAGVDVVLPAISDLYGGFCCMSIYGTKGHLHVKHTDTLYAFKTQLETFISYLRTEQPPFPFSETIELMKIIIGGLRSRAEGGRTVQLSEIEV